jgi:hypothetical protein
MGRITYISERTLNFIKINYAVGEDSDEDPTHVSQLLCTESVKELLDSIGRLRENCLVTTNMSSTGSSAGYGLMSDMTTVATMSSTTQYQPIPPPPPSLLALQQQQQLSGGGANPQIDVDMNMLFFSKVSLSPVLCLPLFLELLN